jgi:hypothetical protein
VASLVFYVPVTRSHINLHAVQIEDDLFYELFIRSQVYSNYTINVPVVYMARDVMILMLAYLFRGPLEGLGPENRDFFEH